MVDGNEYLQFENENSTTLEKVFNTNEHQKLQKTIFFLRQTTIYTSFYFQVARRLMHRIVLVFKMPQLIVIDGIPVTDEERNKAEMFFYEQTQVRAELK